jgi:hypothetical protein
MLAVGEEKRRETCLSAKGREAIDRLADREPAGDKMRGRRPRNQCQQGRSFFSKPLEAPACCQNRQDRGDRQVEVETSNGW